MFTKMFWVHNKIMTHYRRLPKLTDKYRFRKRAEVNLQGVYKDDVATTLAHDSPQEIAKTLGKVRDWKKGEVEAIPGKTMPALQIVERDYTKVFDKYISLGPNLATGKIGA